MPSRVVELRCEVFMVWRGSDVGYIEVPMWTKQARADDSGAVAVGDVVWKLPLVTSAGVVPYWH